MTPDKICTEYRDQSVGLVIKMIVANPSLGEADVPMMLVEGTKEALMFLSKIIAAVAQGEASNSFAMSPTGPGSDHFDESSTHGIYVRRINSVYNEQLRPGS
jgi:hypothetical protein